MHERYNDLPFLSERMQLGKVEKLVTNLHDKIEYTVHIRNLKQTLNHKLILEKVHTVIIFNQKDWQEPYIKMNTYLRKVAKTNFEKDVFKLINNALFGKLWRM